MHRVAEYGVAAHWRYKEGGKQGKDEERIAWLRQLLDWQRDLAGAEEFVETVKTDIFHDQVFVYTPKGDVLDLPAGATPLDFAYRIHTDLGHQTVGAKVNGRMVPLNSSAQERRRRRNHAQPHQQGPFARLAERQPRLRPHWPLARKDPPVVPQAGARRKHRARPGDARKGNAPPRPRTWPNARTDPPVDVQLRELG